MTAASRGWGPGWPHCNTSNVVVITCGGLGFKFSCRREVAPLFHRMISELEHARGKPFRPGWCWGGACRAIANTKTPSNHSWWLAGDFDAPENPYASVSYHRAHGHSYPGGLVLVSTMPQNTQAIAAKYGMRWGGVYSSKPDPMHFEFMGTPEQAAALIRATNPVQPPRPQPLPPPITEPVPPPVDEPQEDDSVLVLIEGDKNDKWWVSDGTTKRYVPNRMIADHLVMVFGAKRADNGEAYVLPQEFVDSIPEEVSVKTAAWDMRIQFLQAAAEGFTQYTNVGMTPDGKVMDKVTSKEQAEAGGGKWVNPTFQWAYETVLRERAVYEAVVPVAPNGSGGG